MYKALGIKRYFKRKTGNRANKPKGLLNLNSLLNYESIAEHENERGNKWKGLLNRTIVELGVVNELM